MFWDAKKDNPELDRFQPDHTKWDWCFCASKVWSFFRCQL